jgi:hypothetical protein
MQEVDACSTVDIHHINAPVLCVSEDRKINV